MIHDLAVRLVKAGQRLHRQQLQNRSKTLSISAMEAMSFLKNELLDGGGATLNLPKVFNFGTNKIRLIFWYVVFGSV